MVELLTGPGKEDFFSEMLVGGFGFGVQGLGC